MDILIAVAIILLVAVILHVIVTNFLPVEARIKQLIQIIIWGVAIITILIRTYPLLAI